MNGVNYNAPELTYIKLPNPHQDKSFNLSPQSFKLIKTITSAITESAAK